MLIAYVGNKTNKASDGKSFNTENHIALTLEKLGHEVDFIQESEIVVGNLLERVGMADLFLWTRTWKKSDGTGYVSDEDLQSIKDAGIPTASFHLDKYAGIKRDGGIGQDTFWKTDYVFSPEGSTESKRVFKAHGINQIYLPPAVFEDECYIAEPVEKYKHDIVFVGGGVEYMHPEWPYRGKLVTWLKETYGDRFAKYGGPDGLIRGEELNKLYTSSKIVIGDSLCKDFIDSYYYSDRAFEVTGRGGFMIAPYIAGITDHFVDRKEAVFYAFDNFVQLKNLIDYYLEHDDEREAIRRAGFERTKRENTYTNRMEFMINYITDNKSKSITDKIKNTVENMKKAAGEAYVEAAIKRPPIKINLGSGNDPLDGHVNVDMLERDDVDIVHNLMDFPYPFEDNSASHIKAIDVIEHLDNYTDDKRPAIMAFIDECARILQPGGELYIQAPGWDSEVFKIDPTHVRGFHINTFDFFDPDTRYGQIRDFYDGPKFKVRAEELENKNLRFWMTKR